LGAYGRGERGLLGVFALMPLLATVLVGWISLIPDRRPPQSRQTARDLLRGAGRDLGALIGGVGQVVGGCIAAVFALAAMLVGLIAFIWLVKRIWEAV
jgi:hypothetical protein